VQSLPCALTAFETANDVTSGKKADDGNGENDGRTYDDHKNRVVPERGLDIININARANHRSPGQGGGKGQFFKGLVFRLIGFGPVIVAETAAGFTAGLDQFADEKHAVGIFCGAQILADKRRVGAVHFGNTVLVKDKEISDIAIKSAVLQKVVKRTDGFVAVDFARLDLFLQVVGNRDHRGRGRFDFFLAIIKQCVACIREKNRGNDQQPGQSQEDKAGNFCTDFEFA
jgi:hypothetical protein